MVEFSWWCYVIKRKPGACASGFQMRTKELLGFFRIDGDLLALCIEAFKLHLAVNEREQSEIPAHAHIVALVEVRTALTNDDVASLHDFARVLLNTKVFGVTVAAVTY